MTVSDPTMIVLTNHPLQLAQLEHATKAWDRRLTVVPLYQQYKENPDPAKGELPIIKEFHRLVTEDPQAMSHLLDLALYTSSITPHQIQGCARGRTSPTCGNARRPARVCLSRIYQVCYTKNRDTHLCRFCCKVGWAVTPAFWETPFLHGCLPYGAP